MNSDALLLQANNLVRKVTLESEEKTIIDDFSFSFERSALYTIIGPSGSGKTSLLRLFPRLDEPDSGEIILDGTNFRNYSPCDLRRRVAYLFQVPHMFPGTVADNLRYAQPSLTSEQIDGLLRKCSIRLDFKERTASNLSEGEKQRVAVARLLSLQPDVLLLDEPSAALDPTLTRMMEEMIANLIEEDKLTVIMTSHDPHQAARVGGQSLLIVSGKLVESGEANRVINDPQSELGRAYKRMELE